MGNIFQLGTKQGLHYSHRSNFLKDRQWGSDFQPSNNKKVDTELASCCLQGNSYQQGKLLETKNSQGNSYQEGMVWEKRRQLGKKNPQDKEWQRWCFLGKKLWLGTK